MFGLINPYALTPKVSLLLRLRLWCNYLSDGDHGFPVAHDFGRGWHWLRRSHDRLRTIRSRTFNRHGDLANRRFSNDRIGTASHPGRNCTGQNQPRNPPIARQNSLHGVRHDPRANLGFGLQERFSLRSRHSRQVVNKAPASRTQPLLLAPHHRIPTLATRLRDRDHHQFAQLSLSHASECFDLRDSFKAPLNFWRKVGMPSR